MHIVIGVIGIVAMLFVGILASTVVGGVVGWVVEAVLPFVIVALNKLIGLTLTGFEMGAVLGFTGSFFKSSISQSSK